ncbi:Alpha/Beta hydrolase protein [Cadophora sp. MPI-SDFR-AT-0126]|nr:Alpha/Beta hydrolase protein [Leotiomycetes sp. MPI-SDFR-AT-0126]
MAWSLNALPKRALNILKRRNSPATEDDKSSSRSRCQNSPRLSGEEQNMSRKSNASTQSGSTSPVARGTKQSTKRSSKRKTKGNIKTHGSSTSSMDHRGDSPYSARGTAPSKQSSFSPTDILSENLHTFPSTQPTIIPHRGPKHTHTFIFLHDWNSNGSHTARSFLTNNKSRTNQTLAEIFPSMRFVFPNAPLAYSTRRLEDFNHIASTGMLQIQEVVASWFDIDDFERLSAREEKEIMLPGLRDSICDIAEIITSEANIVGIENIVLGGHGQGAATALMAMLVGRQDFGSFVGSGGWLPFQREIRSVADECFDDRAKIQSRVEKILGMEVGEDEDYELEDEEEQGGGECVHDVWNGCSETEKKARKPVVKTPIFMGHAVDDEMVPYQLGRDMGRTLHCLGFQGHWQKCKGGHGIDEGRFVDDIADFLEVMLVFEGRSPSYYDNEAGELEASGLPSNVEKIRRLLEEREKKEKKKRKRKEQEEGGEEEDEEEEEEGEGKEGTTDEE